MIKLDFRVHTVVINTKSENEREEKEIDGEDQTRGEMIGQCGIDILGKSVCPTTVNENSDLTARLFALIFCAAGTDHFLFVLYCDRHHHRTSLHSPCAQP
jgi:hypothetical protein